MHVNEMKFEKKPFPRVLSLDLCWKNKTYKLKRSIEIMFESNSNQIKSKTLFHFEFQKIASTDANISEGKAKTNRK